MQGVLLFLTFLTFLAPGFSWLLLAHPGSSWLILGSSFLTRHPSPVTRYPFPFLLFLTGQAYYKVSSVKLRKRNRKR